VQANNNPVDRAGLAKMIPAIDWNLMLAGSGLSDVQNFVVNEVSALRDGAALLNSVPVASWQKYLAFHLANNYSAYLPKAFDVASFELFARTLRGVEQQRDRIGSPALSGAAITS
jgi:endothelin-converting enzyme/putative endopeptidase